MSLKNLIFVSFVFLSSIQLQAMLRDMAVMMGSQMAGNLANQAVSAQFEDMTTALTTDQTNIIDTITTFTADVKAVQSAALKNTFHFFNQASTNIANLFAQQQATLTKMDDYLQSSLSQQGQMQSLYLQNPTKYDQIFTLATMYTPQGVSWKNLFPVGNWEYDQDADAFLQMTTMAMMQDDSTTGQLTADKAINNSIFTEWFSRSASYEIECEITLYEISYPFFAGLIFNKARWVSGDLARLQQYRLCGLYGTTNNNVNLCQLCCAEAFIKTPGIPAVPAVPATTTAAAVPAVAEVLPVWSYPFAQILAGGGVLKISVPPTVVQDLNTESVTFRLKIKTSPGKIQIKFWTIPGTEPTVFTTITSVNKNLYLYHGIGFMAPGCMAQFKLLKPTSLLFSSDAQTAFKTQAQTWIKSKMTTNYAATIDALAAKQTGAGG